MNLAIQPIARVFWPTCVEDSSSGYLIGWNVRSFVGCVACVIPSSQISTPEELEGALQCVANDPSLKPIHEYCAGPPIILGLWNPKGDPTSPLQDGAFREFLDMKKQSENFWLTMTPRESGEQFLRRANGTTEEYVYHPSLNNEGDGVEEKGNHKGKSSNGKQGESLPHLDELFCFGYQYVADSQVVFYRVPSKKHYYSCSPLSLDVFSVSEETEPSELEVTLRQVNSSLLMKREIKKAIKMGKKKKPSPDEKQIDSPPVESPDVSEKDTPREEKEHSKYLDISASPKEVHSKLKEMFKEKKDNGELGWGNIITRFQWYLIILLSHVVIFWDSVCKKISSTVPSTLRTLYLQTSTGQQFSLRLSLCKQIPWAWINFQDKWSNHPKTRRFSVNFYNLCTALLLDTLLGALAAILVTYNVTTVVNTINIVSNFFTDTIIVSTIKWLMGWPAGFKLNWNVDSFMGQLFLFYTGKWEEIISSFPISCGRFVILVSYTGIFGLSMMLSLMSDLLVICVLHVNWFYTGSAKVYMHQTQAMSGLWKLFRGKKKNVLRDRIDSCDYDIDQLLLGTILFSVIFFLLPTIAIYYIYFSIVRFLVFSVHMVLFFLLQLLNHFPLYGAALYLIDSSLFTGGICFKVVGHSEITHSLSKQNAVYLALQDQPGSFGSVFIYLAQWTGDFFKNNSIPELVKCALLGMPIKISLRSNKGS